MQDKGRECFVEVPTDNKMILRVKWLVDGFVSPECNTGIILRNLKVNSYMKLVDQKDEWKYWCITDGEKAFGESCYDDDWSPIDDLYLRLCEKDVMNSRGDEVHCTVTVYWIPETSAIYSELAAHITGTSGRILRHTVDSLPYKGRPKFKHDIEWKYKQNLIKWNNWLLL